MSDGNSNTVAESDHRNRPVHVVISDHGSFYRKLMGNRWDAEELEQNLQIKFFEKSRKEPDFLKEIQNLDAFITVSARFEAINMWRKDSKRKNHDSIDDEEKVSIFNKLSDKGSSRSQIEREIDEEPYKKIMLESLEIFPEYDQILIDLKLFQGCRPSLVIEILIEEHTDLLKAEFPEYSDLSEEELKEKLKSFVPRDCNLAEAKYRQKLNRELIKRKRK